MVRKLEKIYPSFGPSTASNHRGCYVTIGNPAFCLFLYLTGVHLRDELHHGGDVSEQKIECRPIRTREIGGVSLPDVLYACILEPPRALKSASSGKFWTAD